MGHQIIKQGDGKYGIFSTYSDRVIMAGMTSGEVVEHFAERAAASARQTFNLALEHGRFHDMSAVDALESMARAGNAPADEMPALLEEARAGLGVSLDEFAVLAECARVDRERNERECDEFEASFSGGSCPRCGFWPHVCACGGPHGQS